jgi:hypothetical protein
MELLTSYGVAGGKKRGGEKRNERKYGRNGRRKLR